MDLIEKQKVVNDACGFKTDNLSGLILGLASEVGELASLVALKEGLKKGKPKDLEKFGGWQKIGENLYSRVDESFARGFKEALNHPASQTAILEAIGDELADVLVYLLQICIYFNRDFLIESCMEPESGVIGKMLAIVRCLGLMADSYYISSIYNELKEIAKNYEIDLEKAYLAKCEKLLKRHAVVKEQNK